MQYLKSLMHLLAGTVTSFGKNRSLVWQMASREVSSKYRGSFLGAMWTVLTPLLMLAVYTLVFGVIFKTRWAGGSGSKVEFATLMFSGMVVFNLFSEVVNRAPRLILDNTNFVKKVVFPLEALPWVALISALFNTATSMAVLFVFVVIIKGMLPWTVVLLPFLLAPLALFTVGIAWFLASLGVFLRDVYQVIGILVSLLMFLSPVFYPSSALPIYLHFLVRYNPLAFYIENTRDLLVWGKIGGIQDYLYQLATSIIIAMVGLAWFRRTRHAFADVM